MVLAAGFGTRMRSIGNNLPKPLVKLAGRALLDHVLDRLAEAQIRRAVVNVHYCADQIEAHLAQRKLPEIVISDEREAILETGGGVRKALPLLGGAPFLVHNSDSVWIEGARSNLRMLIGAWRPVEMSALLLLAPRDSSIGYEGRGDFHVDASNRLAWRGGADTAPYVFAGVSILKPGLFEGMTGEAFSLTKIFDKAMARNELSGLVLDGTWMHVGTPAALMEAERQLHEGERRTA
jgi:MurNAc alpha-1-phosphate uridylyltransferase